MRLTFRTEIFFDVFSHCHSNFPFEDLPNGNSVSDNKSEMLILEHVFFFLSLSLSFAYYSKILFNSVAAEMFFQNLTLTNEQLQELYSCVTSVAGTTLD